MHAAALATLTLILTDVQSRPIDDGALQASTQAALAGSGVALRWARSEPGVGASARGGEARVILVAKHPTRRGTERVLGAVFRDPGRSRAIWLYVDEVRAVLERGGTRYAPGAAMRELSVALGRVLAHELAHLLAPGRPHSEEGLMARAVNRAVLGRATEPLDAACLTAIRVAVAAPPVIPARTGDAAGSSLPARLGAAPPPEPLAPAF